MSKIKLKIKHKDKWRYIAILLVSFSISLFIIMLIGGLNGSIYIKKYYFNEIVRNTLQREKLIFTLYGYCIDNSCTKDISHNFGIGIY